MKIINRLQLLSKHKKFLENAKHFNCEKIESQDFRNIIITQSTSGSKNEPLIIPRYYNDIFDIINRFLKYYVRVFREFPKKIAMLGGISHIKAASSIKIDDAQIQFFDLNEFHRVIEWEPEIITCYPNILREIFFKYKKNLNFVKAIKVGGEKLFPADCETVFEELPNVLIIEQYGSTELPALAFRNITQDNFKFFKSHIKVKFDLQNERFSYLNSHKEGWHPFIAKDNFPELLFDIEDYYDTGDEALWMNYTPIDFRRRGDVENDYFDSMNFLLKKFHNFQIDLNERFLIAENSISESMHKINNIMFSEKKGKLKRIPSSNKLPLIINLKN